MSTSEQSICPICKNPNSCTVDAMQNCWCFSVEIPEQLIQQLPPHLRNVSCICSKCIMEFKQSKVL